MLVITLFSLVPALGVSAPAAKRAPPRAELVVEVTSNGEQPRDLLALLVPFFASRHYAAPLRFGSADVPEGSAAFEHPDGDFVVTAGRFNCVVVAYYARYPGKDRWGVVARDRAGLFEVALMDFLESLPTPRPTPREILFGSKYCVGAT